ncbi:amine oxidase [Schizopora paradoxa]|uniref:Amine oxidase n=1 Tax=Schizopora paradoxa TaxID=27342 RepID=A0A0H2RI82_9AGAM|nr:amine oxidase [Schizopora paradoxa]
MKALTPTLLLFSSALAAVYNREIEKDASVLILGGGVTGVIAARTLHERGHDNFIVVDARGELGGRMQTESIGPPGRNFTVEQGPNWVQGTQTGNGPKNPILTLAEKHGVKTQFNDLFGSLSFFDFNGAFNFTDVFNDEDDDFTSLTVSAGTRLQKGLLDLNARSGYSLVGSNPLSHTAQTSEYYLFDWEYAQTPEESSWIGSSLNNNFTFEPEMGGFSEDNLLCIDQRGFKTIIQAEAAEFLKPSQLMLNSTVKTIEYSTSGVKVTLTNGKTLSADYVLVTFSVGVLQNSDVSFSPALPDWKQEAIQSITMATYTKIFLQFPDVFWFDTEMGLYADLERGKYPVWQSLDHKDFLPGSGILFVTVTGDYSKRVEALSDEQVQSEALAVLQLMFPNTSIPEPTAFFFPRWHSNPLFRGSYSNMPAAFVPTHQDNLRATVSDRLWFAGEATSFKYYGFLHGAYFEGLNVTNKLADCIEMGGCTGLPHVEEIKQ